ncbi:Na+/H+ antiporter subunit D [Oleisolibacter albus]|uniref:Na+/H+ antiporter subunit D n=1 Tax=Oleisolibacter albus TaxID=2171757 RepID=UPI000DF276C8|nr:Na+/H+ antiporter subunit D [Oleisolibacter albus]
MNWLVAAPILIPMATAALTGLAWRSVPLQRALTLAGMTALLLAAIALLLQVQHGRILVMQMGGWAAPFGITLVADMLTAIMVLVSALMALAVAVYSLGDIDPVRARTGFHPVFCALMVGVGGAFVTGDLFNMYVWFEVMLIGSFVLLALGGRKEQLDGAIKYACLNLVATAALLLAVALLYGVTGTLNMAELALRVRMVPNQGIVTTIAVLFIVAFGMKAAVFPLFFWLPAAYHTPAVAVQAIFAGLLTKVGVYALLRTFTLIFTGDTGWTHGGILMWIAGLTMLAGVLGSLAVRDLRRAWSWQVVAHIGYMIMGLALYTPLAVAGVVFYLVHDIVVKTNLFLGAGVVRRLGGSADYAGLGGLFKAAPLLAVLLFVPMASLAGFPPLSGFWSKLVLVQAGLEQQSWAIVAVALVTGLLTMALVGRVWAEVVWKPHPDGDIAGTAALPAGQRLALVAPLVLLSGITVAIGLYAQPVMDLSSRAAADLLSPEPYIRAILGEPPPPPVLVGELP